MLKTTVTPDLFRALVSRMNDIDDLAYIVGPASKLHRSQQCPITRQFIDSGYFAEGVGYCSLDVAAVMLIRGLVEYANSLAEPFSTKAVEPAPAEVDPNLNIAGDYYLEAEPKTLIVEPGEAEPPVAVLTQADAPVSIDKAASSEGVYAKPAFGFTQQPDAHGKREKQKTVTIGKNSKINVMDLPSGTILRFEQDAPAEFDRTPVDKDFDMSQVPTMDRDLVRTQFDVAHGISTTDVTMKPFTGEMTFERPEFDINTLPEEDRPIFEGYKGGTLKFSSASDVRRYEQSEGIPELMEALEADEREEFGDEAVDHAKAVADTIQRTGKTASIRLPAKCLGAETVRR